MRYACWASPTLFRKKCFGNFFHVFEFPLFRLDSVAVQNNENLVWVAGAVANPNQVVMVIPVG